MLSARTAEQEWRVTMSDLIDRQAALEAILNCSDIFVNNKPVMIDKVDAQEALMEVPTAEPKKGKWLPDNTDIRMYYVCSECKQATQIPTYVGGFLYNYCPNCGARMEGKDE